MRNRILEYDTILFDIFDTLIVRDFYNPKDLFAYLALSFKEKPYTKYIQAIRRFSEERARFLTHHHTEDEDITFDYIYDIFHEYMSNICHKEGISYSYTDTQLIKDKEIEIELLTISRREEVCSLLEIATKANKEIYLISDMYLNKLQLENILQKNHIIGYKDILISSETKKSKHSGNMYLHFKEIFPNHKNIIMIGDNEYSDQNANKYGIDVYLVPRRNTLIPATISPGNKLIPTSSWISWNSIISGMWVNYSIENISNKITNFQEIGFKFIAPLAILITKYLKDYLKQKSIHHMVFLSRDSYFFYQTFLSLYKKEIEAEELFAYYIPASRSLLQNMDLKDSISDTQYQRIVHSTTLLEVRDYFERLGLDSKKYITYIKKYFISETEKITTEKKLKLIQLFKEIEQDILEITHEKKELYKELLKKQGLDNKNIVALDLGWWGSILEVLKVPFGEINTTVHPFLIFYNYRSNSHYQSLNLIPSLNSNLDFSKCFLDLDFQDSNLLESFLCYGTGSAKTIIPDKISGYKILYNPELNSNIRHTEEIKEGVMAFLKRFKYNNLTYDQDFFLSLIQTYIINTSKAQKDIYKKITFISDSSGKYKKNSKIFLLLKHSTKKVVKFLPQKLRRKFIKLNYKIYKTLNDIFS